MADLRRQQHSLDVLRRLRWPVPGRLGVHPWGDERSGVLGPGVEYADAREYQFGEDSRLIDWNLTARSDSAFVRLSHPDRGIDVWLLVDVSPSLDWGTANCLKKDLAVEFADAAALLLTRYGNRVGAIVFDSTVRRIVSPTPGRHGRHSVVATLRAAVSDPGAGGTDLELALRTARRLVRRPSLLIVISDFLLDAAGWRREMRAVAERHEVVAVRVVDPRELEIPDIGVVTFEDPETGRQVEVDTSSRRLRERFRAAAAEQRARFTGEVREARGIPIEISTGRELVQQLVVILRAEQARQRRLRSAR
ncbi:MAG TPA: DUF58 domain-containing protein [Candidatus Dormibacteraeota bacterium]